MKIFAGYQVVDKPWGGANNFLRALYQTLSEKHGVHIVYEPSADCDVFFFGQTGRGPAADSTQYSIDDMRKISSLNPASPMVMRQVNLRRHSSHNSFLTYLINPKDRLQDDLSRQAAALCDYHIYQSAYQKTFFKKFGVDAPHHTIIHNGASPEFSDYSGDIARWKSGDNLKIFSSSFSTKESKNHHLIADMSVMENVVIHHAGPWPEKTERKNVILVGTLEHKEIAAYYRNSHYLYHPGIKESCSNSVIEALSMGLPVLYGAGPGSSGEIVRGYGMAVPSNDLSQLIADAKNKQAEFAEKLSTARNYYTMARAAQEYYDAFLGAIRLKQEGL